MTYYGAPHNYKPAEESLAGTAPSRRHELEVVVERMFRAGWPTPQAMAAGSATVAAVEAAQLGWSRIVVGLAERYLLSTTLQVATLVALGPLAETDIVQALDLAGFEPVVTEAA